MATKSYEVVLFPDKSSKATFFRVQSQGLCKGFTSSFLFLTVVELAEFLFVSLSNDCSQDLLKKQILDVRISVNPIGRFGFIRSLFHLLFRPCQFYLK